MVLTRLKTTMLAPILSARDQHGDDAESAIAAQGAERVGAGPGEGYRGYLSRPRVSRWVCVACVMPPKRMSAWRWASPGDMPRWMFSSVAMARCEDISSVRSWSRGCLWKKAAMRLRNWRIIGLLRAWQARGPWRFGKAFPVRGVGGKLFTAEGGDGVKLRLAIVVGSAPAGGDPTALLEADESSIDGALVEKDFVAGGLLDAAGDAVAVHFAHGGEGLEHHEVEGSLQ